jgi:hypothetical protein
MKRQNNTTLIIRVQARDGMFLGPDSFGGAFIKITDVNRGKIIAEGFTDLGDSGSRSIYPQNASSPHPIIVPTSPSASFYWLTADTTTVAFTADINLKEPSLLEVSALIPLPPAQENQFISTTQWIFPDQDFSEGPGLILEVSGLWIQPEIISVGKEARIRAKVTMMCGCEINNGSPWLPDDFEVDAIIRSTKKSTPIIYQQLNLNFQDNSQFVSPDINLKTGNYKAEFRAIQKSTGNTGFAKKEFKISRK